MCVTCAVDYSLIPAKTAQRLTSAEAFPEDDLPVVLEDDPRVRLVLDSLSLPPPFPTDFVRLL